VTRDSIILKEVDREGRRTDAGEIGLCLSVEATQQLYNLVTIDDQGVERCLTNLYDCEGGWGGIECTNPPLGIEPDLFYAVPVNTSAITGLANYTIIGSSRNPMWNNNTGGSGPWPHTRYLSGYPSGGPFTLNLQSGESPMWVTASIPMLQE
jgi:hypothetical protein